jgi:XTP/dITP diphosphohydrolase
MNRRLLIASNNDHKIRELRALLGPEWTVLTPGELRLDLSVAETGSSFSENALLKARGFAEKSGESTIADDSGLVIDALRGEPGIYSARYGGPDLDDAGRIRLVLRQLHGIPAERRTARFVAAIALVCPDREAVVEERAVEGIILDAPVGDAGFGYDPIFFHPPSGATFAQLDESIKNLVSHRALALRAALEHLKKTPH